MTQTQPWFRLEKKHIMEEKLSGTNLLNSIRRWENQLTRYRLHLMIDNR
ncbi:hypothetical protein NECAME_18160 [Necator americanus]|uniref:Uncharacterized protein n=1 Tax=Necator americanus TaxID=51031 RepID=W2TAS4_NECAM|nr:hypothetical protein NECAME_18160 [Necator americanus]ETN79140.1 hypothetical protein NECAME_18160 [Necator americanus]